MHLLLWVSFSGLRTVIFNGACLSENDMNMFYALSKRQLRIYVTLAYLDPLFCVTDEKYYQAYPSPLP